MAEFVVIRLGVADHPVQWIRVDDNGTRRGNLATGSLEQAARDSADRTVIVLVPATDVLTTSVQLPIRSGAKLRAALPFALEENLADDIDSLHFAVGAPRESGRLPVTVVAQDKMDAWLARLGEAGIEAARIVPENYGLARIPGTMSVLIDDHCSMYNDGADTEFVLQGVKPSDLLVAAGQLGTGEEQAGDDGPSGHLVAFCDAEHEQRLTHDWVALRHELHSVDVNILADGALPKLAVTIAAGHGVNLLQGRYGPTADYSSYFSPWKNAAILLLGLALVAMAARGVDYYRLNQEEAILKAQFAEEYRFHRPDDARDIVDPVGAVASIKRALGTVVSPQVFLPSFRELSLAIAANSSAEIEAISYRAGVINIRLTTPDVATLDNIQKAISASGRFRASIQSTDQVADKIKGRIQIREPGS